MSTIDQLKQERLKKIEEMKKIGWNPYPSSYDKKNSIKECRESEGKTVKTAGKIFSLRTHGNIAFADLKDETGKIQIFFQKKLLGDLYKYLSLFDIGDYLGVEGQVVKTVAGEISIAPTNYTLLGKSLLPLPHEWFGLKNIESRYRQRYLDLLMNPQVRQRFNIRSKLVTSIRKYLDNLGFFEVETPVLQPLYGGANAKPFVTHFNALDQKMYLRLAPELYLKRLIAGGYERVYEIAKDFRNEGLDHAHNPEFTMIEWYEAYADYQRVMDVTEGLFKYLAKELYGNTKMKIEDKTIDIGEKWPRIEMTKVIKQKLGLDVETMTDKELIEFCRKEKIDTLGGETKGQLIFLIFEHRIPKTLIEPVWIIDYPEDVSPLSKSHPTKKGWVERFEGYMGGKEICDGWSELTDPIIQRQRFINDVKAVRKDREEAQQVDENFIESMEYGLPPLGGIGIGIDRLTMFFTNTWAIKEIILFPTLKNLELNKTIPSSTINQENFDNVFYFNPSLLKKFPQMKIGVAIIKNVDIHQGNKHLEELKKQIISKQTCTSLEQIGEISSIKAYRNCFKAFGIDWHSRHPSADALLRRVIQGKGIYNINTLVDAYNLAVLETHIALGAFDLKYISLPTTLRLAKEGETIKLLGESENTKISEGEMVYSDSKQIITLDLNYRDADYTKVTKETKDIILFADGCDGISEKEVIMGLNKGIEYIQKFCGGNLIFKKLFSTSTIDLLPSLSTFDPPSSTVKNNNLISREKVLEILNKNIKNKNLIKHCLAVESAMKNLAKYFKEDENKYGIVGLSHDADWEQTEKNHELHGKVSVDWLKQAGEKNQEIIETILSHNYTYNHSSPPSSKMAWSLYCCDDLTGLIVACALVMPSKKLSEVTVETVIKKMGSKSFAAAVKRDQIKLCEEKLNIKLEDFIGIVLKSMQSISQQLGL